MNKTTARNDSSREAEANRNPRDIDQLIKEAKALALYVARHGDSLSGDDGQTLYHNLLEAIADAESDGVSKWKTLMETYAKVTAITYKKKSVNGRTLLDTQAKASLIKWPFAPRNRPISIGLILFLLAMILEVLIGWSSSISDPNTLTGFKDLFYRIVSTLSRFLVPAIWGGIGACVFLMKRLSGKLFEMAYEESRVRGEVTRVVLGAMLGVVIVVLFFPSFGEQIQSGDTNLTPGIAAFIAGLGIKPVYAAFETLSEELARRIRGK